MSFLAYDTQNYMWQKKGPLSGCGKPWSQRLSDWLPIILQYAQTRNTFFMFASWLWPYCPHSFHINILPWNCAFIHS